MQTFLVNHALNCNNRGLLTAYHNEICDNIIHIARQAFYPNCIHGKPLIHLGHIRLEEEVYHRGIFPETQGDVSIRGLWEIQTELIIGVRFGDADADTWKP